MKLLQSSNSQGKLPKTQLKAKLKMSNQFSLAQGHLKTKYNQQKGQSVELRIPDLFLDPLVSPNPFGKTVIIWMTLSGGVAKSEFGNVFEDFRIPTLL